MPQTIPKKQASQSAAELNNTNATQESSNTYYNNASNGATKQIGKTNNTNSETLNTDDILSSYSEYETIKENTYSPEYYDELKDYIDKTIEDNNNTVEFLNNHLAFMDEILTNEANTSLSDLLGEVEFTLGITDPSNPMYEEQMRNLNSMHSEELAVLQKYFEVSSIQEFYAYAVGIEADITQRNNQTSELNRILTIIPYQRKLATDEVKQWNQEPYLLSDEEIAQGYNGTYFSYQKFIEETNGKINISPAEYMQSVESNNNLVINDGSYPYVELHNLIEASKINPDFLKLYNYYYYNEGIDKANEYLMDITEEVNKIIAQEHVKAFQESLSDGEDIESALKRTALVSKKGLEDGIKGFGEGFVNWFDDSRKRTVSDYEAMYISMLLQPNSEKEKIGLIDSNGNSASSNIDFSKDYSGILNISDDIYSISNSIGNMLPSMALSIINPMLGTVAMGISAGGHSYHQAMIENESQLKAIVKGVISGVSEAGLERVLGGLPLLGSDDVAVTSVKTFLIAMRKEATEEGLQEVIDMIVDYGLFGKTVTLDEAINRIGKSALYGAITSGIMNGAGVGINLTINTAGQIVSSVELRQYLREKLSSMGIEATDENINDIIDYINHKGTPDFSNTQFDTTTEKVGNNEIEFRVQSDIDSSKQAYNIDNIMEYLNNYEGLGKQFLERVTIVDSEYNLPEEYGNHRVAALSGNGEIIIYANENFSPELLAHELAHLYDEQTNISSSEEYRQAVEQDGGFIHSDNLAEDFAEVLSMYEQDPSSLDNYPNRKALIIEAIEAMHESSNDSSMANIVDGEVNNPAVVTGNGFSTNSDINKINISNISSMTNSDVTNLMTEINNMIAGKNSNDVIMFNLGKELKFLTVAEIQSDFAGITEASELMEMLDMTTDISYGNITTDSSTLRKNKKGNIEIREDAKENMDPNLRKKIEKYLQQLDNYNRQQQRNENAARRAAHISNQSTFRKDFDSTSYLKYVREYFNNIINGTALSSTASSAKTNVNSDFFNDPNHGHTIDTSKQNQHVGGELDSIIRTKYMDYSNIEELLKAEDIKAYNNYQNNPNAKRYYDRVWNKAEELYNKISGGKTEAEIRNLMAQQVSMITLAGVAETDMNTELQTIIDQYYDKGVFFWTEDQKKDRAGNPISRNDLQDPNKSLIRLPFIIGETYSYSTVDANGRITNNGNGRVVQTNWVVVHYDEKGNCHMVPVSPLDYGDYASLTDSQKLQEYNDIVNGTIPDYATYQNNQSNSSAANNTANGGSV